MNQKNLPPTTAGPDLGVVVSDVLGDLAFMVTDPEAMRLTPGAVWLQGEIQYFGPVSGQLQCWCTRDFAVQLAANLLGLEVEEGGAQVAAEDAVREFMNVLCGQLVTAWHGAEAVFDLSIPTVCERLDPPGEPPEGSCRCQLSIDGEPVYCVHLAAA